MGGEEKWLGVWVEMVEEYRGKEFCLFGVVRRGEFYREKWELDFKGRMERR